MKRVFLIVILVFYIAGCAAIKSRMLERSGEAVTVGTYQLEMTIDRSPDEVFDYLADWSHLQEFMDYADLAVPSDTLISREGQYVDGVTHLLGMDFPVRYILVEYDPGRAVTVAAAKSIRGWMRLTMDPVGENTLLRGNLHLFIVPDSPTSLLITSVFENERLMKRYVRELMTEKFQAVKAHLEGGDPGSALVDRESYKIFVDAYFKVEQDFNMGPEEIFEILRSPAGLNTVFSERMTFEPADDLSGGLIEVGDVLAGTADLGLSDPIIYDSFVVQIENDQIRMVLTSPDVVMEWDCLVLPTLTGSRVIVVMIVNYTETMAGQSFDVVMHTSEIDQWAKEGLASLKERYEAK